jgi:cytochrome oxidase Cu insertion factor (SCO1/SenC/PrrC family)
MLVNWRLALVLSLGAIGAVAVSATAGDDKAPPEKPAAPAADAAKAEHEKWAEHMGDVPFIVGYEKGMKEVEFTGKPPMLFFTATW